tara:strand:+ start:27 stop:431 length:405 start_codon:yes stop_codon:yes gene_type:complete
MKQLQIPFIFIFSFFIFSCEDEKNEVSYPSIIFEAPLIESFLIGEDINISIFVNHNEVIDNIKYYEIFDCSNDDFDSLVLQEWENIYENEWSFNKVIETTNLPENTLCSCTIQIEATDLNNVMSQTEIMLDISN